jgi:hypothetical protein
MKRRGRKEKRRADKNTIAPEKVIGELNNMASPNAVPVIK